RLYIPHSRSTLLPSLFPYTTLFRSLLAFHQKGVGGEQRAVTHRDAVVDECVDSERAAGAERGSAGLVRTVLLRVTLDHARSQRIDRKSTRLNSSHEWISYDVFCLK